MQVHFSFEFIDGFRSSFDFTCIVCDVVLSVTFPAPSTPPYSLFPYVSQELCQSTAIRFRYHYSPFGEPKLGKVIPYVTVLF